MNGLIPPLDKPDIPLTKKDQPTRLIDFSHVLAPFVNGKGKGGRNSEDWNPRWKGDLSSAVTAGQWTQQRRSLVPDWKIDDERCQLCLEAVGTLQHRFICRTTTSEGGWPLLPKKAKLAIESIGSNRLQMLQTTGMLVVRVPVQKPSQDGNFYWLMEPNFESHLMDGAVWYLDGSMLNGRWDPLRATGFGIAIVTESGKLVGFGSEAPPHWCATAAAAEAWALQFVLSLVPYPPEMRTDCQSLLTTLQSSVQATTAASRH
jgi:hypothetical protein